MIHAPIDMTEMDSDLYQSRRSSSVSTASRTCRRVIIHSEDFTEVQESFSRRSSALSVSTCSSGSMKVCELSCTELNSVPDVSNASMLQLIEMNEERATVAAEINKFQKLNVKRNSLCGPLPNVSASVDPCASRPTTADIPDVKLGYRRLFFPFASCMRKQM